MPDPFRRKSKRALHLSTIVFWSALEAACGSSSKNEETTSPRSNDTVDVSTQTTTSSPNNPPAPNPQSQPTDPSTQKWSVGLGLQNLGNTCFANASHKLLANLTDAPSAFDPSLDPEINQDLSTASQQTQDRISLKKAMFPLFKGMAENHQLLLDNQEPIDHQYFEQESSTLFSNIKDSYYALTNEKIPGDQSDAAEYIRFLLDRLAYGKMIDMQDWISCPSSYTNLTPVYHQSVLSLGIDTSPTSRNVMEALQFLLQGSFIDDYTPPPGRKQTCLQQPFFISARGKIPDQLIIQLLRFKKDITGKVLSKIETPVQISQQIQISLYDAPADNKSQPTTIHTTKTFNIKVVVGHSGSLAGGHCFAYVYEPQLKQWFLHNDSSVSPLQEQEVSHQTATAGYLLLYTK
ncbi:ubiquitin carboxyl-terminal hydrolase [Pajaroellobacter abortibovis]|nr:ubiquitin carboxyl-terminal hydrolase family protein [Pajaroellobacter abortibovis]